MSKMLCSTIYKKYQMIVNSTHIKGNISDLIFTDFHDSVPNLNVHSYDPRLLSDRCIISLYFLLHVHLGSTQLPFSSQHPHYLSSTIPKVTCLIMC